MCNQHILVSESQQSSPVISCRRPSFKPAIRSLTTFSASFYFSLGFYRVELPIESELCGFTCVHTDTLIQHKNSLTSALITTLAVLMVEESSAPKQQMKVQPALSAFFFLSMSQLFFCHLMNMWETCEVCTNQWQPLCSLQTLPAIIYTCLYYFKSHIESCVQTF